jgi:hypothetical protein
LVRIRQAATNLDALAERCGGFDEKFVSELKRLAASSRLKAIAAQFLRADSNPRLLEASWMSTEPTVGQSASAREGDDAPHRIRTARRSALDPPLPKRSARPVTSHSEVAFG